MKKASVLAWVAGLALIGSMTSMAGGSPDGIELSVSRGPGPDDVLLEWVGGQPSFEVFRADSPEEVGHALNMLGQTTTYSWPDTALASGLYFYLVRSTCIPVPTDVCDGLDNDCDGQVDEDHVDVPTTCGVGECEGNHGNLLCRNGRQVDTCEPFAGATPDLCDGLDNDCDAQSVDGSGDPQFGLACDGVDQDLCQEGTHTCSSGSPSCTDFSGTTTDVCNGLDDDCDAGSPDGAEDPQFGMACDGGDGDLCNEGARVCTAGSLICNDNTTTTVDLCNGSNDDCDAASGDGAEDPQLGVPCDGTDSDVCIEGTRICTGGTLFCTDTTTSTVETCNGFDDDCDGSVDEGIQNNNPACGSVTNMGSVSGDDGNDSISTSGSTEAWRRVTIREDLGSSIYVSATVRLESPAGTDFDLYVYCVGCGGTLAASSTGGSIDVVLVRADDQIFNDDTFNVIIEVRFWSANVCADWTLTVFGNTQVNAATCD